MDKHHHTPSSLFIASINNIFYGMTLYPINNFDTFSEMLLDAFVGLCDSHSIMLPVLLLLVLYLFKGVKDYTPL